MSKELLFNSIPAQPELVTEAEASVSPLAEYVLTEMPSDLAEVRVESLSYADLREKQQETLAEISPLITTNTDPRTAIVTQLDLSFMLGGYLPLGAEAYREAPPQLLSLLDQQSDRFGLPARMDYELIIDVNSEEYLQRGHMRTYLDGEPSLHERDFYLGHHESEAYVKASAYLLRSAIENPDHMDTDVVMADALSNMRTFREYMAAYMRMSGDVFGALRPYLASYPDSIRNASGAFMPSVQLAELALHAPTDAQGTYIDESMRYFPRWSQGVIEDWREESTRGHNVVDLVLKGDLPLGTEGSTALHGLLDEFLKFRTTHFAATRKQIPQAFEGREAPVSRRQITEFGEPDIMAEGAEGAKGTAGFDIINVLGGAAYRLIAAKQRLEDEDAA